MLSTSHDVSFYQEFHSKLESMKYAQGKDKIRRSLGRYSSLADSDHGVKVKGKIVPVLNYPSITP
jgi:hypothetical protein